jgi:hypothetical protein
MERRKSTKGLETEKEEGPAGGLQRGAALLEGL